MEPGPASVSCNEKKSWEMRPFMCDDDESRSLVVEAYTEKRKSFGETKHSISCRDCKISCMAFSGTLLPVWNSGVLTRWRLACIIYDIVLITEFLSCFLGNRFCIPCVRWVFQSQTRVLLFCSAVAYKLPVASYSLHWLFPKSSRLSVINSLHSFCLFVCIVSLKCIHLITKPYFFLSDFHMSCVFSFFLQLVLSQIYVSVLYSCCFSVASRLRPTLVSSFRPTCIPPHLDSVVPLSHLSPARPSHHLSFLCLCSQHSHSLPPHCSFDPFREPSFWKTVKKTK